MSSRKRKYTSEIIEFIRSNVKQFTDKEVAKLINDKWSLGINEESVSNAKHRYGIKTGFGRGHFPKGHKPANPILKGQRLGLKTEFKKGRVPPNRVPIGSERFTKDGYLQIKIKDGNKNNNWIVKHRLIWEQHNGPVPPKHRVVFLDGDKNNLDISNLELMSYGQTAIMSKKNLFYKNAELTMLGSKIANIEIRINKRKREEKND